MVSAGVTTTPPPSPVRAPRKPATAEIAKTTGAISSKVIVGKTLSRLYRIHDLIGMPSVTVAAIVLGSGDVRRTALAALASLCRPGVASRELSVLPVERGSGDRAG